MESLGTLCSNHQNKLMWFSKWNHNAKPEIYLRNELISYDSTMSHAVSVWTLLCLIDLNISMYYQISARRMYRWNFYIIYKTQWLEMTGLVSNLRWRTMCDCFYKWQASEHNISDGSRGSPKRGVGCRGIKRNIIEVLQFDPDVLRLYCIPVLHCCIACKFHFLPVIYRIWKILGRREQSWKKILSAKWPNNLNISPVNLSIIRISQSKCWPTVWNYFMAIISQESLIIWS